MVDTLPISRPGTASTLDSTPLPFGDYELLEHVGRGGMAEVWLARRAVMPGGLKPCALKIIHGRIATKPRNRRMFMQEARLALKLRHANLVSVFDVGEADGRLFMALEWVDGIDLRSFTQRVAASGRPLSISVICHIMAELLQGLRHAHALEVGGRPLGVIHRDIAPHNVLVSAAGEIKLADFGIARVVGEESSGLHLKGRARYMAPEQLCGRISQASDLFSVGAMLHELLAGRRFREDLGQRADWHRVLAQATVPPLTRRDVPPALEALRVGLLQPDPARRIASADAALQALLRCPPWPPGASALQALYARCVAARTRSGLTDVDPSPHSRHRTPRPGSTLAPTRVMDRARAGVTPAPRHGHRSSSCRPPTPRAAEDGATVPTVRRRSLPPTPVLPPRRHRALQWLGRGLWGLTGVLAVVATGLAVGPDDRGACIEEPAVSTPHRAWLRLRGNDRPQAQVRIDMQVLGITAGPGCWVSPGIHELAWRSSPQEPWQPVGSHTLISAKEHLVRVGEDGLAISAYDP